MRRRRMNWSTGPSGAPTTGAVTSAEPLSWVRATTGWGASARWMTLAAITGSEVGAWKNPPAGTRRSSNASTIGRKVLDTDELRDEFNMAELLKGWLLKRGLKPRQ